MNRSFRWFVVLGGLGGLAIGGSALAGQVRGKIAAADKLMPPVYVEAAKADQHRYTWREPSPTVKPEFRALTANPSRDICIAAVSSNAASPHDPIQITITGGHTIPTTLAVSPGTILRFVNHDPFPHKLYRPDDASFKDTEMSSAGSRDWTAPGSGSYEFRDRLAPTLHFFVVVDPGVVEVVFPGHNGSFSFKDLPTGEYFLKAFFNGKEVGKPVQATATRGNVDVKEPLTLQEAK